RYADACVCVQPCHIRAKYRRPQNDSAPAIVILNASAAPSPINTNVSPPIPATGPARGVVVPSPSWPLSLSPQQYAAPAVVTPQVWKLPALTAANVSPPTTAIGLVRLGVPAVVLLPRGYPASAPPAHAG